ncbi:NAD(P)-binding Rossmann-fold superfamily protein, partial [Thalictrum thalictroides]
GVIGQYAVPILEEKSVLGTDAPTRSANMDTQADSRPRAWGGKLGLLMVILVVLHNEKIAKTFVTFAGPRAWTNQEGLVHGQTKRASCMDKPRGKLGLLMVILVVLHNEKIAKTFVTFAGPRAWTNQEANLTKPETIPATLIGIRRVIDCATGRPEEPIKTGLIRQYAVPILEEKSVWGTDAPTLIACMDTQDIARLTLIALCNEKIAKTLMTFAGSRAWTTEVITLWERLAGQDANIQLFLSQS